MQSTPSTRLAEHLLGEPLKDWVLRHRRDDRGWPWISQKLREVTDGQVELSRTWLWKLYGDADAAGARADSDSDAGSAA